MEPWKVQPISFPADAASRLPETIHAYLAWLAVENSHYNLTRVPESDWMSRHILDSLAPRLGGWSTGARFLDLGTGCGLPGIPLGILCPDALFTLLDSRQKVIHSLNAFLKSSGLAQRGSATSGRAEEIARLAGMRESFSCVVTRAVAALPILVELGVPLLEEGGELWAWKSDLAEISLAENALRELNAEVSQILKYTLPGEEKDRFIIAIQRTGPLDDRYPRRAGMPEKRPL